MAGVAAVLPVSEAGVGGAGGSVGVAVQLAGVLGTCGANHAQFYHGGGYLVPAHITGEAAAGRHHPPALPPTHPHAHPPTQPPTHQPNCASCAQRTCAAMHRCIHVGAACPRATLQPHHVGGQQEAQSVTRQAAGDWPGWQGVGCGGAPPDQQQWQERHPQLLRSRQCHPGGCGHQVCDRHHRPAQALQGAHLLVLPRRSRLRLPSSTQCSSSTVALVGRL